MTAASFGVIQACGRPEMSSCRTSKVELLPQGYPNPRRRLNPAPRVRRGMSREIGTRI
jgi:hypothetical protein